MGKIGADRQFEEMMCHAEDQEIFFLPTPHLLSLTDTENNFISRDIDEISPCSCDNKRNDDVSELLVFIYSG